MKMTHRISPFLWFDDNAEEAVKFYTSIFPNSSIGRITRYGEGSSNVPGKPPGSVMTIEFTLDGMLFAAINGGPHYKFSEAISFVVNCKSQEELDYYWNKLTEGGDPQSQQCGWLKDKFGLSWQVVPARMFDLLQDPDPAKSQRVMEAVLQMKKIDLPTLERAHRGG